MLPRIYYSTPSFLVAITLPALQLILDRENRFAFFGNMVTSVWCAVGIVVSWLGLYAEAMK